MTLRRILRLALPWRWPILLLVAMMLGQSLASLAVPWFAGLLAADVLSGAFGTDWGLVARLIGLLALASVLTVGASLVSGRVGLSILSDLRSMVHDHVIGLPLGFHHDSRRGDLMSLMTWEVGRLSNYLTGTLVSILPAVVTAAGAMVMMARIDLTLAMVVPVLIPVFFVTSRLIGRRLRGLSTRVQKAEAEVMARAQQSLEILPAIKTFTREPETTAAYRASVGRAQGAAFAELSAYAVMGPVTQFITGAAAVILLALAGKAVGGRDLSASGAVSFMLYAALLTRPVSSLVNVWGATQVVRGVLDRMGRVLDLAVESGGTAHIGRAAGAVAVTGVHFAYPDRPPVLRGVNLQVGAGEWVALTGANGAGKSTLTALLMGLMAPDAGVIRLDGTDIATLDLRDLRRQFGHVPQRPLLFDGTIRDNIAFGLPGATDAQVVAAARAAQADDFVRSLPEGYDTMIGDEGVRLSGGQSQRVALARALIKDPPVLILDEATSMYDLEGESAFVSAAESALRGRTVILITHRPATLALASRVLRLEDGRLREMA
ncbi:MAG: ABC transporter ATP-binding protein [Rubellimicrobium sp.]|nr:ABC transporter ATP-binding protein [Rubellimicrobium sp.]